MGDGADHPDLSDICDGCGETFHDCDCEEYEEVCPDCGDYVSDCYCDDD